MNKKEEILNMDDVKKLPREEQIKYEIAEELGIAQKVFSTGWKSLSAKESGRIGGIMASRKKQKQKSKESLPDVQIPK